MNGAEDLEELLVFRLLCVGLHGGAGGGAGGGTGGARGDPLLDASDALTRDAAGFGHPVEQQVILGHLLSGMHCDTVLDNGKANTPLNGSHAVLREPSARGGSHRCHRLGAEWRRDGQWRRCRRRCTDLEENRLRL